MPHIEKPPWSQFETRGVFHIRTCSGTAEAVRPEAPLLHFQETRPRQALRLASFFRSVNRRARPRVLLAPAPAPRLLASAALLSCVFRCFMIT